MKILILTICILCSAALASAAESVRVLSFTASWCKPCQQMKASWSAPAVQNKLKNFQFHAINIDQKRDVTNRWFKFLQENETDTDTKQLLTKVQTPMIMVVKMDNGKPVAWKWSLGYLGSEKLENFLESPK